MTQWAFTETLLRSTLKTTWDTGGNPNVIMLNGFNKQKLSFFTGGATRFDKAEDKRPVSYTHLTLPTKA